MNFIYLMSILLLISSFLLLKKTSKKENIINSIIYTICFIFPYQVLIVYISGLLNLGGSLLYYSIINILISALLLIPTIKKKKIQPYYLQKKEIFLYIILVFIIFVTIFIRFRGFTALTYLSDDSSIHYRMATHFQRELKYLTKTNSKDLMYTDFSAAIPVSYINGGFFLKLFENFKPYKAFIVYDMLCLILSSILLLSTLIKLYHKKKNDYLPILIISILYSLAFPLNNILFGFCYLGIGIMVTNLIIITIKEIETDLNKNMKLNLILLFILNLGLFFSYYLFVPNVYLALGIYYIILYKNKKIDFNTLLKYGIITLIIPFTIGICHFILPRFINKKSEFFKPLTTYGFIYDNILLLYLFIFFAAYLVYKAYKKKLKPSNYLSLNIYIISVYCAIFITLLILQISRLYYFYKLFYLFSLFIAIYLPEFFIKKKKVLYTSIPFIIALILLPPICGKSKIAKEISKTNIYSYNSHEIFNSDIRYNKEELKILEQAKNYSRFCTLNNEFPIITSNHKKYWFYSITNDIATTNFKKEDTRYLDKKNISFSYWIYGEHPCLVYFYEEDNFYKKELKLNKNNYEVLYKNKSGAILKKKQSKFKKKN